MSYKKVKSFSQSKAGKVNGYCLQNVRLGFGINVKYPNAITAWKNTQQHADRNIPSGVDVPLFYTYGKDGHVNVRLSDGRIWNDGTVFKDLADYLSKRPQVSYLGWGESLNGVRVIEHTPDPAPAPKPIFNLPPVDSKVKLRFPQTPRTTFKAGTANIAGYIHVKDNTYEYVVRGHDSKFKNRIIINSASGGGNGVSLALYYLSGNIIPGWERM